MAGRVALQGAMVRLIQKPRISHSDALASQGAYSTTQHFSAAIGKKQTGS